MVNMMAWSKRLVYVIVAFVSVVTARETSVGTRSGRVGSSRTRSTSSQAANAASFPEHKDGPWADDVQEEEDNTVLADLNGAHVERFHHSWTRPKRPRTLAPTSTPVPSPLPTQAPDLAATPAPTSTSSPTEYDVVYNDVCEGATEIFPSQGQGIVYVNTTADAAPLTTVACSCSTCPPTVRNGRWYTFRGRDILVAFSLCHPETPSGQVVATSFFSGSCFNLKALGIPNCINSNVMTNGPDRCDDPTKAYSEFVANLNTIYYVYVSTDQGSYPTGAPFGLSLVERTGPGTPTFAPAPTYPPSPSYAPFPSQAPTPTRDPTPPDNDLQENAVRLFIGSRVVTGLTIGATNEPGCPSCFNCDNGVSSPGVWFKVQGNGRVLTVSTCFPVTSFQTAFRFSPSCNTASCIRSNDLAATGNGYVECEATDGGATIDFWPDEGDDCYIAVMGSSPDEFGIFGIRVSQPEGPAWPTPAPTLPPAPLFDQPSAIPVPTGPPSPIVWNQLGQDLSLEGFGFRYGGSLSLSYANNTESVLAIGEPTFEVDGLERAGRVQVFQLDGDRYVQVGQDIVGFGEQEQVGWYVKLVATMSTEVGLSGRLYVGSLKRVDGDGTFPGMEVFELVQGVWVSQHFNTFPQDGAMGADYDRSMVVSSILVRPKMVIRNKGVNFTQDMLGHMRVYEQSNRAGTWTQLGSDDEFVNVRAGGSIDQAAISLIGDVVAYTDTSLFVRARRWDGEQWITLGQGLPVKTADKEFGISLDIFQTDYDGGDLVLAIAFAERDGSAAPVGKVLVYEYDESSRSWVQRGSAIQGARSYNMVGQVCLSEGKGNGSVIAVTSPSERQDTGDSAARVQIFRYQDDEWSQWGQDISEDIPFFGFRCSLSGDTGTDFGVGRVLLATSSLESAKVLQADP